MATSIILSPVGGKVYAVSSGAVYTADSYGIIVNVASVADQQDLIAAGCSVLTPPPTDLLFSLKSANFNSTSDQILTPTFNGMFRIRRVTVYGASISLTTAVGGFYQAASKGGTPIVANTQAYSALTGSALALDCTLNNASAVLTANTSLYFSLTTAQGAAATANIRIYGDVYN